MKEPFLSVPESDLKELTKTALEELIKEKPEMFKEILEDLLEDYALEKAIEEGLKTDNVSEEEVFKVLNKSQ